ncbi:MAG: hypothetical protein SGBAC_012306, partial [Bacillariaceae sp.]
MPHLQAGNDADGSSVASAKDTKTPRRVSETLPIMAATKKQSLEIKGDSYDSDDAEHISSSKQEVITPSPNGAAAPCSPKSTKGPFLSIYGNTRLFSSPIRVNKKRSFTNDESKDGEGSCSSQEEEERSTSPAPQSQNKDARDQEEQDDSSVPATKKPRIASSPEPTKPEDNQTSAQIVRKPIISPTSSNENKEDDECASQFSHGSGVQPYYGRHAFQHPYPAQYPSPHHSPYAPPRHPYGGHGYHHPHYPPPPAGYNMYGVGGAGMYSPHHPPPHGHYAGAPPPHHPNMYYPPPQYHHHPAAAHYPPRSMMSPVRVAQREFPMRRTVSAPTSDNSSQASTARSSPTLSQSESSKEQSIASVADWQRATMAANGVPPSTKRCMPLKEPVPSKFWGPADTTKDIKLPEFHRLVNYPDFLAKARNTNCDMPKSTAADGKKNCVMCGEQRYCSASSLSKGRMTTTMTPKKDNNETISMETDHIIPRQNKG